jgi:hypothetical protein
VNHKHDSEDSYSDPEEFPGDLDFNHDEHPNHDDFFPEEEELPIEDRF